MAWVTAAAVNNHVHFDVGMYSFGKPRFFREGCATLSKLAWRVFV
jgi:hypothetical protein